jgi:hypothetical protein
MLSGFGPEGITVILPEIRRSIVKRKEKPSAA